MIRQGGLWLKILLVASINVVLLLAVFVLFARVQFRLDVGSFLLAPASYRMLSISRLAALQLPNTPREHWDELLSQYSNSYPSQFYLFDSEGKQVAGKPIDPPKVLFADHGHGPGRDFRPDRDFRGGREPDGFHNFDAPPPGDRPPLRPHEPRDRPFPIDMLRTTNPTHYWAAVHIPISVKPGQRPYEGRLVWRFDSLWTNSFFFDYKPWAITVLLIVLVSVACWLPLIRSMTRTILGMMAATSQIAEGHFEVKLPETRRDELGRLSASINRMAERLAGYVNGQRRFLGDIAHELCSPVARIQLSLGILEQRAGETERRYVETIDEEIQHMSSLVNELLSFSKASLGATAAPESVNVRDAINRAIERERTGDVTIELDVPTSLYALAQPDYVFRSVSNVLRNAIRYAGIDGPIEISARQIDSSAVICVADRGPGVPAGELEDILKPFYRPEAARQRETGGVGLGLAIVRTCIEACGGSVTCRNREPKGFEVDMRLPLAPA